MTPVLHRFRAIHRARFTARIAKSFLLVAVGMLSVGATQELRPARADQGRRSKPFPHDCNPTRIKDEDIENFHLVDTDLYRGGRPAYRQDVYLELAELGIRTIVNLETGEAKKEEAEVNRVNQVLSDRHSPQIKFIQFPISPFPQVFLTGVSDRGIRHLFEELQQAPKPVFLHCAQGKDRTGAIVALYRMRRHELLFDRAYQEALYYRFNESSDGGLIKTIRRYQDPKRFDDLPDPDPSAAPTVTVCIGGSASAPMPVSDARSFFFAKSSVE